MANAFKKGDIVVLKSGGPPMTVDKLPGEPASKYDHDGLDGYRCEWFKGASAAHGVYAEHLLEPYVKPTK